MFIDKLLNLMAEKKASDIFISAGSPISIKIQGTIMPVNPAPMDPEQTKKIVARLAAPDYGADGSDRLIIVATIGDDLDDYRQGQDQHDIGLVVSDADPVGVAQSQPLPRKRGDLATSTRHGILERQNVAHHLEIFRIRHLDREPAPQGHPEVSTHLSHRSAFAPNLVHPNPTENLLFDIEELVALHVLEGELVAQSRKRAPYLKRVAAVDVLDREIVAERDEVLLQYVLHVDRPRRACALTGIATGSATAIKIAEIRVI